MRENFKLGHYQALSYIGFVGRGFSRDIKTPIKTGL